MLSSKGFDLWADGYDKSVNLSEESNEYPFAGYRDVLAFIYQQVRAKNNANVLDIGFGTGVLTAKLYDDGYNIVGIDFSNKMLDIARQKMPQARLIQWDFSKGLPDEVKKEQFDFIISTYAIHHLTETEKVEFIHLLSQKLTETGMILLGDVSFRTRTELEVCKESYSQYWDDEEIYFVADEIIEALAGKYLCEYTKLSHCAGVLRIKSKE